jgi:hypothetical protein
MRSYPAFLLAGLFLAATASHGQMPDTVKEGLWEISIRADIQGQPLSAAPMVVRQCITQTTATDLMNQLTAGGGSCEVSNFSQAGPTASWNLRCSGQIEVNGTAQVTMQSDGFSGNMNMLVGMGGQTVPLNQSFEARWVGTCK